MKSQFHVDRGTCSTAQENYDAAPAREIDRPQTWSFVGDFQGMAGDGAEPDAQFFVETWTLGAAAAVENFKQRRQELAEVERPSATLHDVDDTATFTFVEESAVYVDFISSFRAPSGRCNGDSRKPVEEPCAQAQPAAQEEGFFAGEVLYPLTPQSACRLLGVAAGSTLKQIKAAYRQRVSQWHPDRLSFQSDAVQRRANEQMAAINEAYHLLCNGMLLETA